MGEAGQLSTLNSHKPCSAGQAGPSDPPWVSVWEIHPIYHFEVSVGEHGDQPSSWVTMAMWDQSFNHQI